MTVLGTLLAGDGPPVLQTCRLEGLGGAVYGREAVAAALASLPSDSAAFDLETTRAGLWVGDDVAIFADLIDGHVQRLWVLSDQAALTPAGAIDVPSDPDLTQAGGDVRFEPLDHVELRSDHAARIVDLAATWSIEGLARIRPVVLRAASVGDLAFALVRLEAESTDRPATPVGFNALLLIDGQTVHRRSDEAGRDQITAQGWTPSF